MRARWSEIQAWSARHALAVDLAVAVFLSLVAVASARLVVDLNGGSMALTSALGIVTAVALAARRRVPLVGLVVCTAVTLVGMVHDEVRPTEVSAFGVIFALYAAGAYAEAPWRDRVRWSCVLVICVTGVWQLFGIDQLADLPGETSLTLLRVFTLVANVAYFVVGWRLGDAVRERRERTAQVEERNRQLAVERDENARRAVLDERVRIARELHDVVAHHVSVMGVQAGAARRVLEKRPDLAAEALTQIEASSREAVAELQRLLGFLRSEDGAGAEGGGAVDAPQPSLDRLPDLVAAVAAELPVRLERHGEVRALPPTVELSAYRVVQEALTNCLKHAGGGARAEVHVTYGPDALDVLVTDDGRGASAAPTGGHGLVGMRERVALHGGQFRAGPRPGGGFQVRATFPLRLRAAS